MPALGVFYIPPSWWHFSITHLTLLALSGLELSTERTSLKKDYPERLKKVITRVKAYNIKALLYQYEDFGRDYFPYDGKIEHSARDKDGNLYTIYYPSWVRAEENKLNYETVKNSYWDKWLDFRCYQNAQITGIVRAGVHEAGADKTLFAYSGLQSETTRNRYMTDWRYYPENCDIAIAGIVGSIAETKKALAGWPWMGRVGTYAYPNKTANNYIYQQFVASDGLGVRIFDYFNTTGATYYLTSLLATYGSQAKDHMPAGYEISD